MAEVSAALQRSTEINKSVTRACAEVLTNRYDLGGAIYRPLLSCVVSIVTRKGVSLSLLCPVLILTVSLPSSFSLSPITFHAHEPAERTKSASSFLTFTDHCPVSGERSPIP